MKAENLFLTGDGQIKILDFGLAKLTGPAERSGLVEGETRTATGSGVLLGTVGYMSPEQVRGQRLDSRSDIFGYAWTGDGASLVVAAEGNLTRYPVGGGEPEKLLFGRDAETPAVSRDGRRLAYVPHVVRVNLWRVPIGHSPATTGSPVRLVPSTRFDWCPALSSDGRRLAFTSNRSGASEIWTSDADGSAVHALTSFGGALTGSPRWSPDGRWIAFDSKARGQSDVYLGGSEGGAPQRLETGQMDAETPVWSPDGEWLYFSAVVDGRRQVFKVPWTGGRVMQLTSGGGVMPRAAPDGLRVYYWRERKEPSLWSVSSAGGDERPVRGSACFPRGPSPPGRSALEGSTTWAGEIVPASCSSTSPRGGAVASSTSRGTWGMLTIALAPDEKSLVLPLLEDSTSDIMLVEDFE